MRRVRFGETTPLLRDELSVGTMVYGALAALANSPARGTAVGPALLVPMVNAYAERDPGTLSPGG